MIHGEQRITYLANQRCVPVSIGHVHMQITKIKPKDMAGPVAALDTPPLTAIPLAFLVPRVKDAHGVAGDATLERQQGVLLPRYAACASRTAGPARAEVHRRPATWQQLGHI